MGSGRMQQHDGDDADAEHCVIHMSTLDNGESNQASQQGQRDEERPQDSGQQDPPNATGVSSSDNNALADQERKGVVQEIPIALDTCSHENTLPIPIRYYFIPDPEKDRVFNTNTGTRTVSMFRCTSECQPPVLMNESTWGSEWFPDLSGLQDGLYDIVLGVTVKGRIANTIESIDIIQLWGDRSLGANETIMRDELERMCEPHSGIHSWKLHGQLDIDQSNSVDERSIRMMIKEKFVSSDVKPGFLEIHFMELWASHPDSHTNDSSILVHQPYIWSVNVKSIGHFSMDGAQQVPETICAFAVSGDGRYIATLSGTSMPGSILLLLWDLRGQVAATGNVSPHRPDACAGRAIHVLEPLDIDLLHATISLSWNGSKVAVGDKPESWDPFQRRIFSIYCLDDAAQHSAMTQSKTTSTTISTLQPLPDNQTTMELKQFSDYGMFHIIDSACASIKDELFIACNYERIQIYSIHPEWTHLRTISVGLQSENWHISRLQGQYFSMVESDYYSVSIWNLQLGSLTSRIQKTTEIEYFHDPVRFSSKGDIVAVIHDQAITLHWTATGTVIGSFEMPADSSYISNLRFIQDDSRILVSFESVSDHCPQATTGLVLETIDMTVVGEVIIPQACTAIIDHMTGSGADYYSTHGSTIDMVPSYPHLRFACTNQCLKELKPLFDGGQITVTLERPAEFISPSGLHYHVELQDGLYTPDFIVVSLTSTTGSKKFAIPHHKTEEFRKVVILDSSLRIVVALVTSTFVWRLPESLDDDLKLELVRFGASHSWGICIHKEIYRTGVNNNENEDENEDALQSYHVECCFGIRDADTVVKVISSVIRTYVRADATCRTPFLRYINSHINSYHDRDNPADTLMATFCLRLNRLEEESRDQFLPDMLALPEARWILRPDTPLHSNPLWILLNRAKTEARSMRLAIILINFCHHRARTDMDDSFLFPVLQCLHVLIDSKGLHYDLAAQVLPRFTYFPTRSRDYIVHHHRVIHPPQFRWWFWKPKDRSLYRCKDPILQLDTNKEKNDMNVNFTRDLYVASFALLWSYSDDTIYRPDRPSVPPKTSFSWIQMLIAMIWHKCKLIPGESIKCHDFTLEMLDNPAIAALIEYKWNTMGFNYSMIRFFFQCCYYLLILTVVILQIYGDFHGTFFGAFIVVAVSSSIFLWLEFIQLVRSWKRYISSMYNAIDWFVFGLPLAASINHFFILSDPVLNGTPEDGNAGFLSFSVLFIFLHLLFELRINRSVCKFVTIIIRVFFRIRLFFFIFAGGILAFSIALLHLLHSCPYKSCTLNSKFPSHFYGAVSATLFYMGGRYNSIDDEFDSDNWPFQTMMIVFFFFTVILMLNVLIALINKAFIDGDETWKLVWLQNRLRVVENVENLTFHIPGFREHFDYFPDEIYYSATAKEIEDYRARYQANDLSSDPKMDPSSDPVDLPSASPVVTATTAAVSIERPMQELKGELREYVEKLEGQLQEQKASSEKQVAALQEQMKEMHAMLSLFLKNMNETDVP